MKILKQKILFLLYFRQVFTPVNTFVKDIKHLSYNFLYFLLPGFQQASVRKAIGELVDSGFVERIIRNNQAYFRLTILGQKQLKTLLVNFFHQGSKKKGFFLAILGAGQARKTRLFLENLGFACLKRGVYLRPAPREFEKNLEPLLGKAFFIFAGKLELLDEKSLVADLWHLDKYYKSGADFVTQAQKLLSNINDKNRLLLREKKAISALSDKFFDLIKNTIGLPKNLLSSDWPLPKAAGLFAQILKKIE